MPISALPQETVRLLGSPLVYSSPAAVVKELVDNAIDARATSVEVLISANTVDSIEVRDNGHGIHPQDFASLGHRGCTSKLRSFEEIQTVGGVTLGFRGDALASATSLSTLQIVTRTAEEPTASKLFFSEKGGVDKIERASAPVGTAVKATDLFAKIPVRRQWAVKEATKTISKVKNLLHSYTFAKPHVKLTFRVLDQPKFSWSYAPGSHSSIRQAALQVFGIDLVSQCIEKTSKQVQEATNSPSNDLAGIFKIRGKGIYAIDALLPRPGADPTKISRGGWFSVESRPVSFSKGTIKTLYSTFKARLSQTLDSTATLKNPFVAVNINCPSKSYDPNVEPSKDEVLFANPHHLVEAFERLLDDVYSTTPPSRSPDEFQGAQLAAKLCLQVSEAAKPKDQGSSLLSPECTSVGKRPSPLIPGINTSVGSLVPSLTNASHPQPQQHPTSPRMTVGDINRLEQASPYISPPSSNDPEPRLMTDLQASSIRGPLDDRAGQISRGQKANMPLHDEDNDAGVAISRQPHAKTADVGGDLGFVPTRRSLDVNPWVIAKFNMTRKKERDVLPQPAQQTRLTKDESSAISLEVDSFGGGRVLRMRPVVRLDIEEASGQQVLAPIPTSRHHAPGVPGGAYRSPMFSPRIGNSDADQIVQRTMGARRGPQRSHGSSRQGDRAYPKPRGGIRQYLAREEEENNWFRGSNTVTTRKRERLERGRPGSSDRSNVDLASHARLPQGEPDANLDLGAIRRRQVLAEKRRLGETMGGLLDNPANPEQAGGIVPSMEALRQNLQAQPGSLEDKVAIKTGMPPGDSRAYLTRKECSLPAIAPRKFRRVKSCMLPLETTPAGEETHSFVQTVQVDMHQLCRSFAMEHSQYVKGAIIENALERYTSQPDFGDIQRRVEELLSELGYDELRSDCKVEFSVPQLANVKARQLNAGL